MMKKIKKIPLYSCEKELYTGGIFSGSSYKLLAPKCCKIDLLTYKLNKITSRKVFGKYTSISDAKCPNEYYVVKECDPENIYLINDKYNEVDTIKLKVPAKYKKEILSISFDYENCKIYICVENMVYSVTMQGDFIKEELSMDTLNKIRFVSRVVPKNRCVCQQRNVIKLTCASYICGNLVIAYIKNDALYISEISESGNIINTFYIDDDIFVNEIFLVKGKLEFLVTKQGKYNYLYQTDCAYKCNLISNNMCEIVKMSECRVDCHCEKTNKSVNCTPNLCEIIESIALIETALSHILYAEGEKIEKAVKISCDCKDLIKVNESVAKTITNITMLEQVLTDKLVVALDNCNKCKK